MSKQLWEPSASAIAGSEMTAFQRWVEGKTKTTFKDYAALHTWSVEHSDQFWRLYWDFSSLIAQTPPAQIVRDRELLPGADWFPDTQLNYAENLLRYRDDQIALVCLLETGVREEVTYRELFTKSQTLAAHFQTLGITRGDRVAGWLPNISATVIAMLATTTLGAVWSSCSPDFGVSGALDRFGQIEPKLLIACDGYWYNGKPQSTIAKVNAVAAAVPSIQHTLWVELLGSDDAMPDAKADANGDVKLDAAAQRLKPLMTPLSAELPAKQVVPFTPMNFNDPLYIMYSSGTTGKPKCIVHGIGGTLLQHRKEHQLHLDLTRDDTLFFFTTCGWMMWNWLVSGLATGAKLVLYDGSPFYPEPKRLLDLAEAERATVFGISAKFLSGIDKAGVEPAQTHQLDAMRMLISTGSPLTDEGYNYVYEKIKPDLHLVSMSGGTDIISCFVISNPNAAVHSGEIQCAGLGMGVEVWNDAGERVVGEKGELVCTNSFVSCPLGFWQDQNQSKFRSAYFERFPGVWAQGDFAEQTATGGFIIYGRSDAVLNPGGVRIGTAEIYRQVEQFPEIVDAVCVGQEWAGDTRVVLFVVMQDGTELSDGLAAELRNQIRSNASPRHVPAKILAISDIPRTMSGKIAELAVRDVIHEREVKNTSALANPEALAYYENLDDLAI